MAASALDRTQTAPRTSGFGDLTDLSALANLGPVVERDAEPDAPLPEAPETPAAAKPAAVAPALPPMGGLADLAGLDSPIERDESPDEAPSAPEPARMPAPAPAPAGLSDLAGLATTIERDSPAGDEPAAAETAAIPAPAPAPAASAPIVPRSSRQTPREPSGAPMAASAPTRSEPDLDQFLQNSGRDLTAAPVSVDTSAAGGSVDGGYSVDAQPEGGAPEKTETGETTETGPVPIEVKPLRPTDPLDPDNAFFGMGHAAQVIEAAFRGMPADPATLELAQRWQDIDGAHSKRYQAATEEFQRHKALEDMRAPDGAQAAPDGRPGRGGGLSSIARGLANMGRRGVEARRRANTRSAGQELEDLRSEYEGEATDFIRNFFAMKSRHYDDRLHEMGQQHGFLNDAISRYNRAFAAAPAAAPFMAAVDAYGREQGLSQDDALAAAASGKAGPQVAALLASVKGATLADPAVDAARAGMREAEDLFSDTARRAQQDFESLLRFSTPDDGFDAEKTSEDLVSKMNAFAETTKDPVAEDEDKAKMQQRMRELANSIQRMIREMFEKMFRAVTGAFGR